MGLDESIRTRRSYPLKPRTIGFVGDELCTVSSNWDRMEVRGADDGEVRLTREVEPDGEWLLHDFHFVSGRYLVVSIGSGVLTCGFRVYDFEAREWVIELTERWSDLGLLGVHPLQPRIAFAEGEHVCIWNLEAREREWTLSEPFVNAVAFPWTGARLALAGTHQLSILDDGTERRVPCPEDDQLTAIAWAGGQTLVTGSLRGRLVLWDAATLTRVGERHLGLRDVGAIVASPAAGAICCTSTDGTAQLVKMPSLGMAIEDDVQAALFDPRSGELIVLGRRGVRRLPAPAE